MTSDPSSPAIQSKKSPDNVHSSYLGDDLIPQAPMIYDRRVSLNAPHHLAWPWIVQLGKRRGGWYLRKRIENFMPSSWRATREIVPTWQNLHVGDRIPDYGGRHDYLEVVVIEAPNALIYRTERFGTKFTWALLLSPDGSGSKLHLRFRGNIQSVGWRRTALIAAGDWLDWITTAPMLAGLAERVS